MSDSRFTLHRDSIVSAALAAAICMAIVQLIGLIGWSSSIGAVLLYGLSLSFLAFGFTYAAVFFTALVHHRRASTADVRS